MALVAFGRQVALDEDASDVLYGGPVRDDEFLADGGVGAIIGYESEDLSIAEDEAAEGALMSGRGRRTGGRLGGAARITRPQVSEQPAREQNPR